MTLVRAGFIPLVDSAPLIAAEAMGFARDEGITLSLTREQSWATLRDKLAVGAVDAAHLLAPITVASAIEVGNPKPLIVALMSLSMNGNAISVTKPLFDEMRAAAPFAGPDDIAGKAAALRTVIEMRRKVGRARLTFAIVNVFSPHNYELRYVLGSAGIDPDRDLDLVVVPPPYVVDHLREGLIDGFCVGAPYNSIGAGEGLSRVIATKSQIWRFGPEKVLGMRQDRADADPELACRLIRAVKRGAAWADDPANHAALAQRLAAPDVLDMPVAPIADSLAGRIPLDMEPAAPISDFMVFDRAGAGFPWRSHALWFYSQMVRWGQVERSADRLRRAADAYRPDLYRAAFAGTEVALPAANSKVEGALREARPAGSSTGRLVLARDGFFDGRVFDPDDVDGYIASFAMRTEPFAVR